MECVRRNKPIPFDSVVCSPLEAAFLKPHISLRNISLIVPGIRDEWMVNEDGTAGQQQRYTGVYEALENGATFVVMGAQITQGNLKKGITAEESTRMTLEEI